MKKFCTKCGHEFEAVGREVICPSCKAQAAEETKRAAILKAKRASWTGDAVPVRISGRASTVIRWFAESQTMPFAAALDALLRTSEYFATKGIKWQDVEPYKSHRRDKATSTTDTPHDVKQDAPQAAQAAKASKPSKPSTAKTASKASKASK